MIPQTDPKASYLSHREVIDAAMRRVLEGGWYILGPEVKSFEAAFAKYIGAQHGIGVGNGTDAVELALRACGVGAGDVAFTVSHTAVATVVGVERAGATAVLVDIDPALYTMDPASLEAAIRTAKDAKIGRPRAVVVVHLYGQPADLDAIADLCRRHDLLLIEDCAQSHGARVGGDNGRRAGSIGIAAAFSFYPTKNLGAIGDGGAVVTSDASIAERARMIREYGWKERYISAVPGYNTRLDELQAAILSAKLAHLDADNAKRQSIAQRYDAALSGTGLSLPARRGGCTHVFHQYVVRSPQRDELRAKLKDGGIGTLVHYPVPVHEQPAYRDRLPRLVPLPHTESAARAVLSLPMFPELTAEQVAHVGAAMIDELTARGRA